MPVISPSRLPLRVSWLINWCIWVAWLSQHTEKTNQTTANVATAATAVRLLKLHRNRIWNIPRLFQLGGEVLKGHSSPHECIEFGRRATPAFWHRNWLCIASCLHSAEHRYWARITHGVGNAHAADGWMSTGHDVLTRGLNRYHVRCNRSKATRWSIRSQLLEGAKTTCKAPQIHRLIRRQAWAMWTSSDQAVINCQRSGPDRLGKVLSRVGADVLGPWWITLSEVWAALISCRLCLSIVWECAWIHLMRLPFHAVAVDPDFLLAVSVLFCARVLNTLEHLTFLRSRSSFERDWISQAASTETARRKDLQAILVDRTWHIHHHVWIPIPSWLATNYFCHFGGIKNALVSALIANLIPTQHS